MLSRVFPFLHCNLLEALMKDHMQYADFQEVQEARDSRVGITLSHSRTQLGLVNQF